MTRRQPVRQKAHTVANPDPFEQTSGQAFGEDRPRRGGETSHLSSRRGFFVGLSSPS